ncbi:hypothetical protein IEO21_01721 [Rhodonia placenta]|uniref:Rab-GAP TBC domain-containing protein n=1 Tax=Rhodonia placenta TaxID=104341 RepID=A0A8H7P9E2_9APHY|nr:hypothetical protein IEO21_01721 [Postia placenta]
MYEEDAGSWSAPQSVAGHRHRPSKDADVDVTVMGVDHRVSSSKWSSRQVEDSAYFETAEWSRTSILEKTRESVASNGSAQLAYADSRPPSSQARTSATSRSDSQGYLTPRVLSNGSSLSVLPEGQASSSFVRASHSSRVDSIPRAISNGSLLSAAPTSRPSSSHARDSSGGSGNAPVGLPKSPRPQDRDSTAERDTKALLTSPPVIPPSESTSTSHDPQSSSQSQLQPVLTPPSSPPRVSSVVGSPPSVLSLAPSPDEDPDGFHVRSTYAQLEMCGVRGDGIEEGVERTRARVGGSRASELRAQEALGDGYEKTRDLTPQELSMLSSLDRYGFYVMPSHDRIIMLPVGPLLKPLAHITTAPTNAPASAPLLPSLPTPPPPSKETSRVAKWGRMLEPRARDEGQNIDSWGIKSSKERKLRERTFKGIPDRWRRAAWDTLMCRFSKHGQAETRRLAHAYREALDRSSTYDVQIDLDVPRTISGHVTFRTRYGQGQRSLFHVLHCLSLHCESCGYCQGMGPIAATFLCYFEPERAYASLVRLHDSYQMHTIFSPGFPGLLEAIYVQERITEQMMPAVYAAFKKHMISTTSYATKWYITLFANSVPFQVQLRLWDGFLLEGHDIFVVVAVAIVWVYRDHITSSAASFETVLSLLSSFFVPEDENALLAWIEKVISDQKLRTSMRQWRADWQRLVAAGQHNQALL